MIDLKKAVIVRPTLHFRWYRTTVTNGNSKWWQWKYTQRYEILQQLFIHQTGSEYKEVWHNIDVVDNPDIELVK